MQYEDTLFRAHQTSGRFVFRGSSFLCHHWPLLLIFLEAAQLSVLFILSGRIGVGVDWVGSHPPFEQLTKKLYRNIIRAFHKLLEIFQNVSRNFLRSCSKVAQNTIKSCSKKQNCFGLVLKYANCTTKVRFLSIFVQFCGLTSIAK